VLIGAWTYRWVQEDAFINFRIIGNLLAGHGPVFNIGERVEAYSDPLWLFTLAGAHEILPFLSLEWLSVILGLVGTASGMLLGGRAIQRFGSSRHDTVIIPLGLLIFSVVAGVWEFATSGLEMGMVFAWLGLSFWLLVRVERLRTSATCCAFVMGLGTLIRPELLLMSAVFLAGLTAVVAAPGWRGPESIRRRWVTPLLASVAMPLMYEVWRMAYFAMVVSNSALAKSAGGSDVPQGAYYVWNFVSTFALWIPFLLVLPLMAPRTRRWWTGGDRLGVIVLLTPVLAGTVDAAYVLHLGGDYMQARLLLPAFLALCMTVYIEANQLKRLSVIAVIGVVAWCAVCAGSLRYGLGNGWVHNMHDERNNWIADTGVRHPIDVSGYLQLVSLGGALNEVANRVSPMRQSMLVVSDPAAVASSRTEARSVVERQLHAFVASDIRPAESSMPFRVVVDMDNVGAIAYLAGPRVYVWDSLSIANPIGSHTTIAVRTIPGHEKSIGIEWMIARFGVPGVQYPVSRVLEPSIAAATKTLRCAPLSSYIHAITAPMTFAQAMSNITHAFAYTAMSFNPDPSNAERQLCEQEG
jgi:arabinofuranosyltransferase